MTEIPMEDVTKTQVNVLLEVIRGLTYEIGVRDELIRRLRAANAPHREEGQATDGVRQASSA